MELHVPWSWYRVHVHVSNRDTSGDRITAYMYMSCSTVTFCNVLPLSIYLYKHVPIILRGLGFSGCKTLILPSSPPVAIVTPHVATAVAGRGW